MISEEAKSEPRQKALHEEIEEIIFAGIRSGKLKPGQKLVLVDQMVKKWKVSRATVQQSMQVLAAKGLIFRKPKAGTFISEGVLDIAEGGWRKTRCICLIVPALQTVEFAALARGVEDAAHDNNLSVIVSSTDNDLTRYEQVITRHIDSGVLGIFMVPPIGIQVAAAFARKTAKERDTRRHLLSIAQRSNGMAADSHRRLPRDVHHCRAFGQNRKEADRVPRIQGATRARVSGGQCRPFWLHDGTSGEQSVMPIRHWSFSSTAREA